MVDFPAPLGPDITTGRGPFFAAFAPALVVVAAGVVAAASGQHVRSRLAIEKVGVEWAIGVVYQKPSSDISCFEMLLLLLRVE
jgi:hypothetical protein